MLWVPLLRKEKSNRRGRRGYQKGGESEVFVNGNDAWECMNRVWSGELAQGLGDWIMGFLHL